MTVVGTSFTRWRAEALGLDYQKAFARICQMGFAIIRLSASWREIDRFGFGHLEWLVRHAEAIRQPIVLTVGMKALGWPEFYLPDGMTPDHRVVQRAALAHVRDVVWRFASSPVLRAWQIENEPFNRSGPQALWLPRVVVRREARAVRAIDPSRPLVLTTFAHFDEALDRSSSRHQSDWMRRLRLDIPAEREALSILRRGDILGVDVYRSIGWVDSAGQQRIAHASPDQLDWIARWQRIARGQGKQFWVTEAQAEPWEAQRRTLGDPLSVGPDDGQRLIDDLERRDVSTALLWGSEYWLWREANGDPRWMESVSRGLRALA
ncbi:MAG TPA: hypothetical protein VM674_08110 [Candidatus Acidoferrum sp.]|nr:hypothetical protein [Candidatus Acidoferrum sp.]